MFPVKKTLINNDQILNKRETFAVSLRKEKKNKFFLTKRGKYDFE